MPVGKTKAESHVEELLEASMATMIYPTFWRRFIRFAPVRSLDSFMQW